MTKSVKKVEAALGWFFSGESPRDLDRVWTPDLHPHIRTQLASLASVITRHYVVLLQDHRESQQRRIVEVVDDWEARSANTAADIEDWFILAAGVEAAVVVRDRDRVARWWKRLQVMTAPKRSAPSPFSVMLYTLRERGELRTEIKKLLDGAGDRAAARTRAALANKASAAKVTDEQLEHLAVTELGCLGASVQVRDLATSEAWLTDDTGESHFFDGKAFDSSNVIFGEGNALPEQVDAHIAKHPVCDERRIVHVSKHRLIALQRHGTVVLWFSSFFDPQDGGKRRSRSWFQAASAASAQRLMRLIQDRQPTAARAIGPWSDPKLGVILRSYSGGGTGYVGVHGDALVNDRRVIARFASAAIAVKAFEQREIKRLRAGHRLTGFDLAPPPAR